MFHESESPDSSGVSKPSLYGRNIDLQTLLQFAKRQKATKM